MDFRISALDVTQFSHLFNLSEEELAAQGIHRMVVTDNSGFPCRVSLRDADVVEGEALEPVLQRKQPFKRRQTA